jgi:hypothetical protein
MAEPYSNQAQPASPADPNLVVVGDDSGPLGPLFFGRSSGNPFGETWGADLIESGEVLGSASIIPDERQFRATIAEFAELRGDGRLRCLTWLNRVRLYAVHRFLATVASSLGISGDPMVFVWTEDDSPRGECPTCMRAMWPRVNGGGVELFLSKMGHECRECLGCKSSTARDNPTTSRVYFVQSLDGGPVKIGRSIKPQERLLSLQTANPDPLCVVATMPGGATVERMLHRAFARSRVRPDGEWFRPDAEVLAFIRELGGRPT